jgi:hypothetical protein
LPKSLARSPLSAIGVQAKPAFGATLLRSSFTACLPRAITGFCTPPNWPGWNSAVEGPYRLATSGKFALASLLKGAPLSS